MSDTPIWTPKPKAKPKRNLGIYEMGKLSEDGQRIAFNNGSFNYYFHIKNGEIQGYGHAGIDQKNIDKFLNGEDVEVCT